MKEKFKLSAKELSKSWESAYKVKDEITAGFEPEDGRYPVAVTMATIGESQSSGRLQITWEYLFLDGDYKGRTFRSYDGLDREEGLPYIMRRIESMGYDAPDAYDELEGLLETITKRKPFIRIQVKTKGEFTNVYVMGVLERENLPEGWEDAMEPSDKPSKSGSSAVSREKPEPSSSSSPKSDDGNEEGLEIEKGMMVACSDGEEGEALGVGEILDIDEDSQECVVKIDGKKHVVAFSNISAAPVAPTTPRSKVKIRR